MTDQSRVSRGLLAALTVACAALSASGASATTFGVTVPADAPVVGAPTAGGATALAFLLRDRLCAVIQERDAPRPTKLDREDADGGDCVTLPILEPLAGTIVSFEDSTDAARLTTTGVTGTDVAAVEWRAAGQTVARAQTVASPLPSAAADLRFFVLEVPKNAQKRIDELVLLDATGTVRRAFDPSELRDEHTSFGPSAAPATTTIRRGHHGKDAWQLQTHVMRPLAPTPLEPERRALLACVTLGAGSGAYAPGTRTLCDDERRAVTPLLSSAGSECGPLGNTIDVLARPGVRRVVAVLGDGHRRAIALNAVPGVPGMRAGVAVLGTGIAVRRLEAIGADGQTLSSELIGLRPAPRVQKDHDGLCSSDWSLLAYAVGLPREPLAAGPHIPVFADAGPRLCLAVDRAPRPPQECRIPAIEASAALLDAEPTADGRYIAGIVPTTVASATLVFDDTSTRDVAATELPGYSGQYATTVRLVAADVPGIHRVVGYRLRDARGRILRSVDVGPELPAPAPATTLLRPVGLPPIRARLFPLGGGVAPLLCLNAGSITGPPNADGCQFAETGTFIATATCSPRRVVLLGLLRRATDRVSVQTASGHEIRAQVAALPPHLRHGAAAAAVVVLPATAAARKVILRGGKSGQAELQLPPARAQCGYTADAEPGSEQL